MSAKTQVEAVLRDTAVKPSGRCLPGLLVAACALMLALGVTDTRAATLFQSPPPLPPVPRHEPPAAHPAAICRGTEPNDERSTATLLNPGDARNDSQNMTTDYVDVFKLAYTRGHITTLRVEGATDTYPVAQLWYNAGSAKNPDMRKYAVVGNGTQTAIWSTWLFAYAPAELYAEIYITGAKTGCRDYIVALAETAPTRRTWYLPIFMRNN